MSDHDNNRNQRRQHQRNNHDDEGNDDDDDEEQLDRDQQAKAEEARRAAFIMSLLNDSGIDGSQSNADDDMMVGLEGDAYEKPPAYGMNERELPAYRSFPALTSEQQRGTAGLQTVAVDSEQKMRWQADAVAVALADGRTEMIREKELMSSGQIVTNPQQGRNVRSGYETEKETFARRGDHQSAEENASSHLPMHAKLPAAERASAGEKVGNRMATEPQAEGSKKKMQTTATTLAGRQTTDASGFTNALAGHKPEPIGAPQMSEGGRTTSSFYATLPTQLSRTQDRNNHVIRPGAIRVHQMAGGAYAERADQVVPDDGTVIGNSLDSQVSIASDINAPPSLSLTRHTTNTITAVSVNAVDNDHVAVDEEEILQARVEAAEDAKQQMLKEAVVADASDGPDNPKRMRMMVLVAALCIVIVAAATIGAVLASKSSSSSSATTGGTSTLLSDTSSSPSMIPSTQPTTEPTDLPTIDESASPSTSPTLAPTAAPTQQTSVEPTSMEQQLIDQYITGVATNVTAGPLDLFPQHDARLWLINNDRWITLDTDPILVAERYSMLVFYMGMGGPFWEQQYQFLNPDTHICEWGGTAVDPVDGQPVLTCTSADRVKSMSIIHNDLAGAIPSEMAAMEMLEVLRLERNQLGGTLPSELGLLHGLKTLNVAYNYLNENIPTEIGNLTSLQILKLRCNPFLEGSVPTQLNQLLELKEVTLDRTRITDVEVLCEVQRPLFVLAANCRAEPPLACSCCFGCIRPGLECERELVDGS